MTRVSWRGFFGRSAGRFDQVAEPVVPSGEGDVRRFDLRLPDSAAGRLPRLLRVTAPRSLYVARVLDRGGLASYEATTLATFLALVEQAGDGAVVDVGANVGIFSWLASAYSERHVIAFEPTPGLASVLRDVARVNALDITVEERALGSEAGTATLYLSSYTDASNSIKAGFRPATDTIVVSLDTLDAFCDRTGVVPAVVKIDVETAEPDVIAGARRVMTNHRPWIICEILSDAIAARIAPMLETLGYQTFQLTDANPAPSQMPFGDKTFTFNNWMFAPTTPPVRLWKRRGEWLSELSLCTRTETPAGMLPIPALTEVRDGRTVASRTWCGSSTVSEVKVGVAAPGILRIESKLVGASRYYLSHGSRGYGLPAEDQHRWSVRSGRRYRVRLPVIVESGHPEVTVFVIQYSGDERRSHDSVDTMSTDTSLIIEPEARLPRSEWPSASRVRDHRRSDHSRSKNSRSRRCPDGALRARER